MHLPQWLESDLTHARNLAAAGADGVSAVWGCSDDEESPSILKTPVLVATALGGAVGVLSVLLRKQRKSGYDAVLGGLTGSAVGFSGSMVWTSRRFTTAVARSVAQRVNAVRDARWLEKNPIDYA